MEWKPITDLPPDEQYVLLAGPTGDIGAKPFFCTVGRRWEQARPRYLHGDGPRWMDLGGDPLSNQAWIPTHWAELPPGIASCDLDHEIERQKGSRLLTDAGDEAWPASGWQDDRIEQTKRETADLVAVIDNLRGQLVRAGQEIAELRSRLSRSEDAAARDAARFEQARRATAIERDTAVQNVVANWDDAVRRLLDTWGVALGNRPNRQPLPVQELARQTVNVVEVLAKTSGQLAEEIRRNANGPRVADPIGVVTVGSDTAPRPHPEALFAAVCDLLVDKNVHIDSEDPSMVTFTAGAVGGHLLRLWALAGPRILAEWPDRATQRDEPNVAFDRVTFRAAPADHTSCERTEHIPGVAYLHGAEDDGPYDVDGVPYCGRCHTYMPAYLP